MSNTAFAHQKGIRLTDYEVVRTHRQSGEFCRGLSRDTHTVEYDVGYILHRPSGRRWSVSMSPSSLLCLPDRSVSADEATDVEIILAHVGDEPIF